MPKKNAFYYFLLECKRLEEAKGRKFKNLGEVTPFASQLWEKMDAVQREPYLLQAKTNPNASVQVVEKVFERGQVQETKKELLQERVKSAHSKNELTTEDFYLISMGYFCRTIDDLYIPAEIGVVKYSLKSGVQQRFHILIDHAKLPTGMAYEALQHSECTHALPIPPHGLGVKDYNEIALKLLSFLHAEDEIPMLFTDAKEVPSVTSMLCNILGDHVKNRTLHIYSVAELYTELQQVSVRCALGKSPFRSVHIAQKLLDDDIFSYTEGISCDYHESRGLLVHCALSQCIRWTYRISRECCKDLGLELIPGGHTPGRIDDEHQSPIIPIYDDRASSVNERLSDVMNMSFVSFATHLTSLPAECGTIADLPITRKSDQTRREKNKKEERTVHPIKVLVEQQKSSETEVIEASTESLSLSELDTQDYRLSTRGNALIHGHSDAISDGMQFGTRYTRCPNCFHRFKVVTND